MTTLKQLRLKKDRHGNICGSPYVGFFVQIEKRNKQYVAHIDCDRDMAKLTEYFPEQHEIKRARLYEVLGYIDALGDKLCWTHNILNRSAGRFPIPLRDKYSSCDPGTERYHMM